MPSCDFTVNRFYLERDGMGGGCCGEGVGMSLWCLFAEILKKNNIENNNMKNIEFTTRNRYLEHFFFMFAIV